MFSGLFFKKIFQYRYLNILTVFLIPTILCNVAFSNSHHQLGLRKIASHLYDYRYSRLRNGNTTVDAWRVLNKHGEAVALIKCTSGNTNAVGEYMTYKLAEYLKFHIYPATTLIDVRGELANQLGVKPQTCALKKWIYDWSTIYWRAQRNLTKIVAAGKLNSYKEKNTFLSGTGFARKLADTLMCTNTLQDIKQQKIVLTSIRPTKNGNPLICNKRTFFVSTPVSLVAVAKDMSNIMLLDAIVGNGDRFPGLNFEFRSQTNTAKQIGKYRIQLSNPRLMSLDNGLTFKGWSSSWGIQEMRYYLRRFDPDMVRKLNQLYSKLNTLPPEKLKKELPFLTYPTQMNAKINGINYVKNNLKQVLSWIDAVKQQKQKEYIPNKNPVCKNPWL